MDKPNIAGNAPAAVELEKGREYCFCTCGLSKSQPFCDGAHKNGTPFKSHRFTAEKTGRAFLCLCKHTKNPPYCDGSHSSVCGD